MNIIINNPYRQLGVYSNSPIKERVANHNKLKVFLKVGKQMDFPLDLTTYLPPINRISETIAQAEANLTLPKEQLRYAQFWFMKVTLLDDIAFNHLFAGNMAEAINIWEKKDNASSLQNRLVCALINKEYSDAISYAELLYSQYSRQFESIVLGDESKISSETLAFDFIDALCDELSANVVRPIVRNESWLNHINEKSVKPLVERIQSAIEIAKASKGKGSTARYDAGIKLANETRTLLQQLRTFLPTTDLQYQMIADKLGLEILQCGIDYFNGSEEADAARKVMSLQQYAMEVVVGKMAKDRCKENMEILQKIVDSLPPVIVAVEDKAVKEELHKFSLLSYKTNHAVTSLNRIKPHMQSIKAKLGADNSYYLNLSTQVVASVLQSLIIEINDKLQKGIAFDIKTALYDAWNATKIMDSFDMESDFRSQRFNTNYKRLKGICEKYGVSVAVSPTHSVVRTDFPISKKGVYTTAPAQSVSNDSGLNVSKDADKGWKFLSWLVVISVILIIIFSIYLG